MLAPAAADLALRAFRSDVRKRRFRVVAVRVRHYESAEAMVVGHGARHGLRALDSLQLAVALDLGRSGIVDSIVTADKVLVKVAPLEGLRCIDPEL